MPRDERNRPVEHDSIMDYGSAACSHGKGSEGEEHYRLRSGAPIVRVGSEEEVERVGSEANNMYHDGESGQGDGGRREEGTTITAAEWNRPGGHDPSVAVRVGEAANPGPRVPASATPAPTDVSTTPVPTDISASDERSPVRVLLDTFGEMDRHDGEEEDGALPPGTPRAPPSERRHKRWQTRGSW